MENQQVWSQRVAECCGNGMLVSQWCQENGINVKQYQWLMEGLKVAGQTTQPDKSLASSLYPALEPKLLDQV